MYPKHRQGLFLTAIAVLAGCSSPATPDDADLDAAPHSARPAPDAAPDAARPMDVAVTLDAAADAARPMDVVVARDVAPLDAAADAARPMDAARDATAADARDAAPTLDVSTGPRDGGCMPAITPVDGMQTARPKGSTCAALGYYEYVPPRYSTATSWPLILEFHGDGERGNGTTDLPNLLNGGLPQLIASDHWDPGHRFVVLSPQMDDRGGMTERTGPSVRAFIAFAIANYNIDPHRIYLTGYSGGAEPIYNYLASDMGGVVAAALPISGWYSTRGAECSWDRVPIWYFHGAVDGTVPAVDHSTVSYNTLVACSPAPPVAPRYTLYANRGHDDWNLTYDLTGMDATRFPVVTSPPGTTPYNVSIYDWFLRYTH